MEKEKERKNEKKGEKKRKVYINLKLKNFKMSKKSQKCKKIEYIIYAETDEYIWCISAATFLRGGLSTISEQ